MKNTICCPLAQLGFENDYLITSQGQIIDTANNNIVVASKNQSFRLKRKNGEVITCSLKKLYRLAFEKEYAEDNIEDLPAEIWKPVDEKGRYFISSLGRVKSYKGRKARLLKPYYNNSGYQRVDICLEKRHTLLVHQLVAIHFIENDKPEEKKTVDHINGDKTCNTIDNLQWLSIGDNIRAYHTRRKAEEKRVDIS